MCNGVGLDITDEEQVAAFIAELKDYNPYLNRTTDHDRHIRDNGKQEGKAPELIVPQ